MGNPDKAWQSPGQQNPGKSRASASYIIKVALVFRFGLQGASISPDLLVKVKEL